MRWDIPHLFLLKDIFFIILKFLCGSNSKYTAVVEQAGVLILK